MPAYSEEAPTSELPTGTVTFLFTDIEGSTQLLAKLGEGYERLLADYRRLLRTSFESAGGLQVDTQGDAFFIAFARAKSAVSAAADAQRKIAAHSWPDGVELKVRMGLTTGEPSIGEEGFIGLPVHRGARICAAAHGGQVLLAGGTRDLVEDALPPGVRLRDLGEHHLRDLERAERIFQLVIDELPSEFPPAKTVSSRDARPSAFEGKEAQLAVRAGVLSEGHGRSYGSRALGLGRRAWTRVFVEALWRTLTQPITVLILSGFLLAAILLEPWIAVVGVAFYAWRVLVTARGLWFLHGLEWMGVRVHALMDVVPDIGLRDRLGKLGGALVDVSRLAEIADQELHAADRKELVGRLRRYRGSLGLSSAELREADALAAKVAALDQLAARERAVDEDSDGFEARIDVLRDRIFEARREPTVTPAVTAEADALWVRVDELRRSLRAAIQEVRQLSAEAPTRSAEPTPPASPDSGAAARALRAHTGEEGARSRGRGRRVEWRCFWRWPFGHAWEPVAETKAAYLRCVECGKASDVRFRAPTSTHADRWGPGGSG
jgi:class 3 adenylate cyclase